MTGCLSRMGVGRGVMLDLPALAQMSTGTAVWCVPTLRHRRFSVAELCPVLLLGREAATTSSTLIEQPRTATAIDGQCE